MKRAPLRRKTPLRSRRHEPAVEKAEHPKAFVMPTVKPLVRGVYGPAVMQAAPKDKPIRSEQYRRLVAALPCAYCGIAEHSQAAHANTGKGAGTKTDDRTCFPLCGPHVENGVMVEGCHAAFDQRALFKKLARRDVEKAWAEQTQAAIVKAGLWPANLPRSDE